MKNQSINDNTVSAISTYPLLVGVDRDGFDTSLTKFFSMVNSAINQVRKAYIEMQLDEEFDDNTWKLICENNRVLKNRWAKKVQAVSDIMGVAAGLTDASILKKSHPGINKIELIISTLNSSLYSNSANIKGSLRPHHVIDVNTSPTLPADIYEDHLQAYSFYINSAYEAHTKAVLDKFALEYNNLIEGLKTFGYEQQIGTMNNTFLVNLFDQTGDLLKTNLSAPAFLANKFTPIL